MNLRSSSKSLLSKLVTGSLFIGLTIILFTYTNCSSSHDAGSLEVFTGASVNTANILNNLRFNKNTILNNKCASCHNSATTDNPLRDITNSQYLIDNKFIVIGLPQTSPLYLDVIDGLMPPPGSPDLTDQEVGILRDWIAAEGGNFDTYIGGTPIDNGGGPTAAATFTQVRQILTQNCTSCHRAGGNSPRLDVDAVTLRGAGLVIPNNAAGSQLLQSFSRMPTSGALGLNSAQAATVRSWINAGAL
ncbi:MAG: hypothetical protein KDD38_01655 [Bdellovibrionales bacterium]|nr:hypothetical protein [Bdellovibrionales bacterium]